MFGTGARIGEAVGMCWDVRGSQHKNCRAEGRKPQTWSRTAHLPGPVHVEIANISSQRIPLQLVFEYLSGRYVMQPWENVVRLAAIKRMPTPHSRRHGFATTILRARYDGKTVAKMGGWRDAAIVLKHYAHAVEDRTITDVLFATNLT